MRETVTLFLSCYCAVLLTMQSYRQGEDRKKPTPDAEAQCSAWWPDRNSDEWWVCYVSLETARCEAEGWCSDADTIVTILP